LGPRRRLQRRRPVRCGRESAQASGRAFPKRGRPTAGPSRLLDPSIRVTKGCQIPKLSLQYTEVTASSVHSFPGRGDPMVSPVGAAVQRPVLRRRSARRLATVSAAGVYDERFLTVNGYEQWVTVRGADRANPVLLVLHGGPGASYIPF